MSLYKDSDFVKVKDKATGEELPNPVPKSWIGTYLAEGLEQVRSTRSAPKANPDSDENDEGEKPESAKK